MPVKFPNIFQNPGYGPSGSVLCWKVQSAKSETFKLGDSKESWKEWSWEVRAEVEKIFD